MNRVGSAIFLPGLTTLRSEKKFRMENMEYYTQRLRCSDAEKDACLETAQMFLF
jgi:hypothetical protein